MIDGTSVGIQYHATWSGSSEVGGEREREGRRGEERGAVV
jgi:hypothetical protein